MADVKLDRYGICLNGKYTTLLCASLFYFRIPRSEWAARADSILAAGYNCVDVYFPWNYHEIEPGVFDFSGDKDADAFLSMCVEKGLTVVARPGPYICSEWDGGALPAWVTATGTVRCADPEFLQSVQRWFDRILPIVKKYEYKDKGGVILMQLDNELDFFDCPDPRAYIGALRDMAKAAGISVPLFACAGQLSAEKAGGLTPGVYPTYNFYPDSFDNDYDGILRYYADTLYEQDRPFLITETNRDAFLLRREYAAGAKLLGAYNQVGGSNFGFTASVNNWGEPLAFLSTLYDFSSLVDTLGEYTPEVDKFRILDGFFRALGERAAKAVPYRGDVELEADFTAGTVVNALSLEGGGVLVCAANFSDTTGTARVACLGQTVEATVEGHSAAYLPFDVPFGSVKVTSGCEPLYYDGKTLVLHTAGKPAAVVNGTAVTGDTQMDGLKIAFVDESAAATYYHPQAERAPKSHVTYSLCPTNPVETALPFAPAGEGAAPLDAFDLYRGYGQYTAETLPGKPIFIEDASDIVSVWLDGQYYASDVLGGVCAEYPAAPKGAVRFVVEKWGNSNFDDARLPSIRLTCRKGIAGIYSIVETRTLKQMRFKLLDEYGADTIDLSGAEPGTRIRVDQWNSTRMPVVCAYSFETCRTADKLYLAAGGDDELTVYVGGKKAGSVPYKYFDLTPYAPKGKTITVTAVYRKRHWAEKTAALRVLGLAAAKVKTATLGEEGFARMTTEEGVSAALPVSLEKGKTYVSGFTLRNRKSVYVNLRLTDCKATVTADGRVAARVMGTWDKAPLITGGSRTVFYVPEAWLNKSRTITMCIECVGKNPRIEGIDITEKN